jgi:hypothetical protein
LTLSTIFRSKRWKNRRPSLVSLPQNKAKYSTNHHPSLTLLTPQEFHREATNQPLYPQNTKSDLTHSIIIAFDFKKLNINLKFKLKMG